LQLNSNIKVLVAFKTGVLELSATAALPLMGVVDEARPIRFNIPHIFRFDFFSARILPDKDNLGDWEIRSISRGV
jgi:hypothetical protein